MAVTGVVTLCIVSAAQGGDQIATVPLEEAAALLDRAAALYGERRYSEAERLARQSVSIVRKTLGPDHPDLASSLNNLAILMKAQGDFDAAKQLYEQSLAIRRKALGSDHLDVADSLNNLANLLGAQGDYAAARPLHVQSLAIKREALGPDHLDVADGMNNLASLLVTLGDFDDARRLYEQSLSIRRSALGPDHPDVAMSLNNLGLVLEARGDYGAARTLYEQSIAIWREVRGSDHPKVATGLNNLAMLMKVQGAYADARALYEQSLDIRRKTLGPDHPDVADSLNNLGALLEAQGDYDDAGPLYEQSLAIRRRTLGPDHSKVASSLHNLAMLARAQGDFAAARPLYEQSLVIKRETLGPDHPRVAASLNNLGGLLDAQGDYDAARPLYEQSLAIRRKALGPDHPRVADSLNNLAVLLAAQGDFAAARPLHEQSLAIWRRALGPDHPEVATSLGNLAILLAAQGDLDAARPLHEQSLAIRREALGSDHPDVADSLNNLAVLLKTQGNFDAARPLYDQSLAIRRKALGRDHPRVADSLDNLAALLVAQGDFDGARLFQEEALAIVESRLDLLGTLSEREALAYIATMRPTLDHWLAAHHTPAIAWTHALRFKGTIGARLRAARATATTDADTAAVAERLATTRRELAHVALSIEPSPDRVERLAALTAESEALQRDLMSRSARYRADRMAAQATPADLCAALPPNAAIVDLLRYERDGRAHYVAFTAVAGTCEPGRIELGPAKVLEEAVVDWRAAMADPQALASRIDARGRRLTELLWTPIATAVGEVDQLLVVPDGPLAVIPFGALPTTRGYLLEQLRITYLDRANDLLIKAQGAPTGALVVGGVDYDSGAVTSATGAKRSAVAACNEGGFAALPGTHAEAGAFAARWRRARKSDPFHLAGASATETAVSAALGGNEVAHLATHGFFATGRCKSALHGEGFDPMLLSGLVLAGANRPPDPLAAEDGVLTAAEVGTLDLTGTGVVVLSACETGLGEVKSGEGVLGLRRAFAISGAHTLVMSLWSVDDVATAELMDDFYTYHLRRRRPLPPVEALRQAQLARLDDQRRQNNIRPQQWAGFVTSRSAW